MLRYLYYLLIINGVDGALVAYHEKVTRKIFFFLYFRHKQVMLEAYERQCDEACKIFAEYQRRLHQFVDQARDVRRSSTGVSGPADSADDMQLQNAREDLYSVKSNRLSEDLIETAGERCIRKACETLAANMIETIRSSFPAFEGSGINSTCQLDAAKLGMDLDCEIPTDVKAVALDCLKNPSLLLQSVITYTSRIKTLIHRETNKIDIRADAELLRCYFSCLIFIYLTLLLE